MITALILPVPTQRPALDLTQDVVDAPLLELLRAAVEASLQAGEYPVTDAVLWLCRVDSRWRRRFGLALLERAERLVLCLPGDPRGEVYGESTNEDLTEEQHDAARTWVLVLRKDPASVLVRRHPSTPTQDGAARFVPEADVRRGQDLYSAVRAVVRGYAPTDVLASHVGLDNDAHEEK